MKILCLYNNTCALDLFSWVEKQGNEVILCQNKLDLKWLIEQKFDLAISYTYRYILGKDEIDALGNNVVNIHNSFLPWNRGADPNLWSIVEHTPRGVTLHYINEGLDKGLIIAQEMAEELDIENETLKSSYDGLDLLAKKMFKKAFAYYDLWKTMIKRPIGKGSYHSVKDGETIKQSIDSYNIKIVDYLNIINRGND